MREGREVPATRLVIERPAAKARTEPPGPPPAEARAYDVRGFVIDPTQPRSLYFTREDARKWAVARAIRDGTYNADYALPLYGNPHCYTIYDREHVKAYNRGWQQWQGNERMY